MPLRRVEAVPLRVGLLLIIGEELARVLIKIVHGVVAPGVSIVVPRDDGNGILRPGHFRREAREDAHGREDRRRRRVPNTGWGREEPVGVQVLGQGHCIYGTGGAAPRTSRGRVGVVQLQKPSPRERCGRREADFGSSALAAK